MAKTKRVKQTRKNHTFRNLAILGLVLAVVVGAAALSGAFSPPATFTVLIHVYDPAYGTPATITNDTAFVHGVSVVVNGPRSFSKVANNGVIFPDDIGTLPGGDYQVSASKVDYENVSVSYTVGPNCVDRDLFGACHVWIAMRRTS